LSFVDTTRGLAMFLVCLSHFAIFHLGRGGAGATARVIAHLALPATTTFMLVSGVVLGILFEQARDPAALATKLFNRGLFLLAPGHVLIRLAHFREIAAEPSSAHWWFVTDTIGLGLLLGSWLVPRSSARKRLMLGAGVYAGAWLAYLLWSPHGQLLTVKDYLLGQPQSLQTGVVFAVLPWLSFYMAATVLGHRIALWRRDGRDMPRLLFRLALPTLGVAALGHVAHLFAHAPAVRAMLTAGQKYPPGPSYVAFGAGVALLLLAGCAWLESSARAVRLRASFAVIGRSSLVVFVIQYYIYYLGVPYLHWPVTRLWPLYFGLTLALIYAFAWLWERYLGNRYLTVGWPWFERPHPGPKLEPAPGKNPLP
jgi:predicted acyltransferase